MNKPVILRTEKLTKKYGQITAVNNLSLEIPEGSVFGILGPNGSGKTTLLGMILGIIKPTMGSFSWFGEGSHFPAGSIGGILEEPNLMPRMSAYNHVKMTAIIKGADLSECQKVLVRVGLGHVADKNAGTFSLGMRQRLAIASALIGKPRVLVLDEPLNGLDPKGISEVRQLIKQLSQEGVTIIISSHILDEIEKVCTHLAILKQGNLVDVQQLTDEKNANTIRLIINAASPNVLQIVQEWPFTISAEKIEDSIQVEIQRPADASSLNRYLHEKNISLSHLVPLRNEVERIFLEKTK